MSQLTPPPELRARLLAEVAREPAPTRSWSSRLLPVAAFIVLWLSGLFVAVGPRKDAPGLPVTLFAGTLVIVATSALALTFAAGARGRSMLGAPAGLLLALAAFVPVLLGSLVVFSPALGSSTILFGSLGEVVRHSGGCLAMSFVLAVPVLGALSYLRRGLFSGSPVLTGAVLGAASGTLAHLVVYAHCAIGNGSHALLGHLLPMLPLMVLGAIVAARMER